MKTFQEQKKTTGKSNLNRSLGKSNFDNDSIQFQDFDEQIIDFNQESAQESFLAKHRNKENFANQNSKDKVIPEMEEKFNVDFSNVKFNKNSEQAKAMGANAFTKGNEISFAPGKFNPETEKGQKLIKHELSHVIQQRENKVVADGLLNNQYVNRSQSLEKEANNTQKSNILNGDSNQTRVSNPVVQMDADEDKNNQDLEKYINDIDTTNNATLTTEIARIEQTQKFDQTKLDSLKQLLSEKTTTDNLIDTALQNTQLTSSTFDKFRETIAAKHYSKDVYDNQLNQKSLDLAESEKTSEETRKEEMGEDDDEGDIGSQTSDVIGGTKEHLENITGVLKENFGKKNDLEDDALEEAYGKTNQGSRLGIASESLDLGSNILGSIGGFGDLIDTARDTKKTKTDTAVAGLKLGQSVAGVGGNISTLAGNETVGKGFGAAGSILGAGASVLGLGQKAAGFKENLDKGLYGQAGNRRKGAILRAIGRGAQNLGETATSIGGAVKGVADVAKAAGHGAGVAKFMGDKFLPGLSVATGSMDVIKGGYNVALGAKRRYALSKVDETTLSATQQGALAHLKEKQHKKIRGGVFDTITGGLDIAAGAATLSGAAAPVGLALGAVSTGLKVGRAGFNAFRQWGRNQQEKREVVGSNDVNKVKEYRDWKKDKLNEKIEAGKNSWNPFKKFSAWRAGKRKAAMDSETDAAYLARKKTQFDDPGKINAAKKWFFGKFDSKKSSKGKEERVEATAESLMTESFGANQDTIFESIGLDQKKKDALARRAFGSDWASLDGTKKKLIIKAQITKK